MTPRSEKRSLKRLIGVMLDPLLVRAVPVYQDAGGQFCDEEGASWPTERRLRESLRPGWIYQRVVRKISPVDAIRNLMAEAEMDDERIAFEKLLEAARSVAQRWSDDPGIAAIPNKSVPWHETVADLERHLEQFGVAIRPPDGGTHE
jgi:hypothetical protein